AATPPRPRRPSPLRTSVSRRLRLSRGPSETPLRGTLAGSGAPAARSTGVQTTRSSSTPAERSAGGLRHTRCHGPLGKLGRPDHVPGPVLPLHDEYPVARLEAGHRVEPE